MNGQPISGHFCQQTDVFLHLSCQWRGRDISTSKGTAEPPRPKTTTTPPRPRTVDEQVPSLLSCDGQRQTVVPVHTAGNCSDIYQFFLENSDLCCSHYMKTDFHPSRWVRTQMWGCSVNRAPEVRVLWESCCSTEHVPDPAQLEELHLVKVHL